jgi:LmbE family N-acetylglucosaminyl deacetylase
LKHKASSFKPQASSSLPKLGVACLVACGLGLAAELDTLVLQPNERILIIAPHPDDEVIACGGLIQEAMALGDSVWVVYLTTGDGSWPSAWRVTGNMFPGSEDYIELGRARVVEAMAGTTVLGLDSTQLFFLGYPDNHLTGLWQKNWRIPLRSSRTGAIADPYGRSGHVYTGRRLLSDLTSLVRTLRPGRVFAPSPLDAHPDHWSAAMFLAIARETWRLAADGPFPDVYCYLVHRPPYPGAHTSDDGFLSPPADLSGPGHRWFTLRLADGRRRTKQKALECHDSQQGTFGSNLYGYVAENELFDLMDEATAEVTEDAPRIQFVPGAELRAVLAAVKGESLDVQVTLAAGPSSSLDYTFFAHSVESDADGVAHAGFTVELEADMARVHSDAVDRPGADGEPIAPGQLTSSVPIRSELTWSARVPLHRTDGHGALLYSAEVRWGATLVNHSGIGRVVY